MIMTPRRKGLLQSGFRHVQAAATLQLLLHHYQQASMGLLSKLGDLRRTHQLDLYEGATDFNSVLPLVEGQQPDPS
jgi:hypothetical protein